MLRYYGLYANAHGCKVRKSEEGEHKLIVIEEECLRNSRKGWAVMRLGRGDPPI